VIPVQFRPAANRDVIDAADWYESQLSGLGTRFFVDLDRVLSRIEASRDQFPIVYRDTHRALLRRFPYGVFFKNYEDRTLVVAVADLRREASRWQRRM
jgi:toxin ParE1/3/4